MLHHHWYEILTSDVADVVCVTTNTQVLVDAPLDPVAGAAQADIDSAMNVTCGVFSAVDWESCVSAVYHYQTTPIRMETYIHLHWERTPHHEGNC